LKAVIRVIPKCYLKKLQLNTHTYSSDSAALVWCYWGVIHILVTCQRWLRLL